MPVVTDRWFTAFTRIMIWKNVFLLNAVFAGTWVCCYPIRHLPNAKPLHWGYSAGWLVACLMAIVSAYRWYYWRRVQKRNIFNDDGTRYRGGV